MDFKKSDMFANFDKATKLFKAAAVAYMFHSFHFLFLCFWLLLVPKL